MTQPQIRPATPQDATGLSACMHAAYARYEGAVPNLPDVSAGIAQDIADHPVWVAVQDGQILGGAIVYVTPPVAKLANIAVHPDAAGKGLGTALVAQIQQQAQLMGCDRIDLTTHVAMPDNRRLYEHLGWRVTDITGTSVHMQKPL